MHCRHTLRSAFTLVELLLTIAILAVLAAMLFVNLKPKERLEQATAAKAATESREIKNALKQNALDNQGQTLPTLSDEYRPICKYGTWREYRSVLEELAVMSDAPDPPDPPDCIDADALVDDNLMADIPVLEEFATDIESGFLARTDCVGNLFVSYPGDSAIDRFNDLNGDGKVTIDDYQWEDRNQDFDDDGDIDFDDHVLFANQFRDYCEPACPCSNSKQIDLAFVVDTSGSYGDEWDVFANQYDSFVTSMEALGYNVQSKVYALPGAGAVALLGRPDFAARPDVIQLPNIESYYTALAEPCFDRAALDRDHSEAWGIGGIWVMDNRLWRPDATRIMFIFGDTFPSGSWSSNPYEPCDLEIVDTLLTRTAEKDVFLFGMYGGWQGLHWCNGDMTPEECYTAMSGSPLAITNQFEQYGDPTISDIAEIFEPAMRNGCGQPIYYSADRGNEVLDVAKSFMVEACLINCDCRSTGP